MLGLGIGLGALALILLMAIVFAFFTPPAFMHLHGVAQDGAAATEDSSF